MTLGLDSESELDISQADTTEVEVDASCLERRSSTISTASETPSRRSRKNTTSSVVTEIAGEDDVFSIPEGMMWVVSYTEQDFLCVPELCTKSHDNATFHHFQSL